MYMHICDLNLGYHSTKCDTIVSRIYLYLYTYMYVYYQAIGLMSRLFANGLGDWDSIPGRVIPKTQKMVLDSILLNIQHHIVKIKGKVEQSREWSSALPYTSV